MQRRLENISRQQSYAGRAPVSVALKRQINVMHAVILRDIRSRYFNHGLGFLVAPLFPVAHVGVLLTIYTFTGRHAVFGDDMMLFFATGLMPVLTITYVSRFMSSSIVANRNMLSFPAVHLMDIVLARSLLEFAAIVISVMIIIAILISFGTDPFPYWPAQALACMAVTALLAVGVGIIVSVISAMLPAAAMIYALFTVVVYLSSGAPIYLDNFPEEVVYLLSFNPAFQCVSWMRQAYYQGYPAPFLDKTYLSMWALCALTIGLFMERGLRKYILQ
ncbi:ABC transporter permease [Ensifer sp. YR511]|uniref:ABC transporter permease n=1 Tax=Ensifer sp. YR511 TaxID=1855294 RepID=UPI0008858F95|nr:capsular polysaccharide transport system permease protein [Ensifer sp. YR511]